jgi:penicillin-binding protein 1A
MGIARAAFTDLRQMRAAQGASTITQQVVKNMVLTPERHLSRKIKEMILSVRIEQNLSKEDILFLYLNHIYFGHNRYGVEEAALFFFGKPVDKLTLAESALLAGLPQSPMRLSPIHHPEKAKQRQIYVLQQMAEHGFITRAQADQEIARPIALAPRGFEPVGPYYAEDVRKVLVERYGEQKTLEGGLRVDLGMDRALQELADQSLQQGLEELDHKFGMRPPELSVDARMLQDAKPKLLAREQTLTSREPSRPPAAIIWDFANVRSKSLASVDKLVEAVDERALEKDATVVAPVIEVTDDAISVDLGKLVGSIPLDSLKWARPWGPAKWTTQPKKASDVLAVGQLVRVRVLDLPRPVDEKAKPGKDGKPKPVPPVPLSLAPTPLVQGAVVVLDPETREVLALSGGYDFVASAFDRATQAKRQPGSAFKPILYAAALASGRFTAASIVNDAPDLFRDPWTGKEWKPKNFEDNEFEGPMPLRRALAKSKNTVAVRLIDALGPTAVIDMARKAGVNSQLPESLTLALGTGEVTPIELASAYAAIDSLGRRADPVMLVRVTDRDGKVLEEHHAVPEETIPPAVAYVLTSMMRSVIDYEHGTGYQASELKRPLAGKTGTTSDGRDAWFSAFTPDMVTTVWVGFDDNSPMGGSMTGARAALPVWLRFMREALEKRPRKDFPRPPGVEAVQIDRESGLRAPEGAPGHEEFFVEGTAPKDFATRPGEADPTKLFLEDTGTKRP